MISEANLAALRAEREQLMTATGVVHRATLTTSQTSDKRQWPVHHTETGYIRTSRQTVVNRDGLLQAIDAPEWATHLDTHTQPGDVLHADGRWYVVGATRALTWKTAETFTLTEVVYHD